jgi:hypothetical protein
MKSMIARDQMLVAMPSRRSRKVRALGLLTGVLSVLLLLFLAWPYATLWRIDQAVRDGDMTALAELVDLESVRAEIKKKLNKDADSTIGELSDSFIRWLEQGIGVMGNQAVERLVTLDWVREKLLAHSPGGAGEGFLGQVTYAFFDSPNGFFVRIGPSSGTPVQARSALLGLTWRISAVYY